MTAASMQRQVRGLLRGGGAQLSGRGERGPDRKVRRNSYDREDPRAKVFRPVADGTTAAALGWLDCLLKTVSEWDDWERKKGGARPLGLYGVRVLEVLVGRRGRVAIDFRTGRLDPAIDTIAAAAHCARGTVIRALARLRSLGVLDWVRRTQRTDNAGGYGPQREQVSNAYFFAPERMPARIYQRFRDLWARWRVRRQPAPTRPVEGPDAALAAIASPELRATLAAVRTAVDRVDPAPDASPPSGQYPRSGVEG